MQELIGLPEPAAVRGYLETVEITKNLRGFGVANPPLGIAEGRGRRAALPDMKVEKPYHKQAGRQAVDGPQSSNQTGRSGLQSPSPIPKILRAIAQPLSGRFRTRPRSPAEFL